MPKPFEVMLRIIEEEYMLKPVRIMVVKDYGNVHIDGTEYPLHKGVELEVPLWLAELLVSQGVANVVETPLSIEDIARVHFTTVSARTPAELEPLPRNFYQEAKRFIKQLDEEIRREFNAALLEEKQKAIQYLLEIIDRRLTLIMQSIRSPTTVAEISSKLSQEESALLEEIRDDVEKWKRTLTPRS